MRTIETTIYQFDELPTDEAKEKAREWLRQGEREDFDPCYEPFETAAKILGITFADRAVPTHGGKTRYESAIRWSGFYSQGDGASFVGTFTFAPGCAKAIRAEFGTDTVLHQIADELTVLFTRRKLLGKPAFSTKIEQDDHRYYHANTMSLAVELDDPEQDNEQAVSREDEDALLALMRDFANWIYAGLEEQWDYILSDEQIDETMRANEYEFDEDGDRV